MEWKRDSKVLYFLDRKVGEHRYNRASVQFVFSSPNWVVDVWVKHDDWPGGTWEVIARFPRGTSLRTMKQVAENAMRLGLATGIVEEK